MIRYEDAAWLPLHLNSEPWMNLDAYGAQSAEVHFPVRVSAAQCAALPTPRAEDAAAATVSAGSRTAARRHLWRPGCGDATRRRSRAAAPLPSARAPYPLDLHLLLRDVDDAADGVRRFDPLHHWLEPAGALPPADELAAVA